MSRWKLLCAIEVLAIGLAWWWFGSSPDGESASQRRASDRNVVPAEARPDSLPERTSDPAPAASRTDAAPPHIAPEAPAAPSGKVSMIGVVRDEQGHPVLLPIAAIHRDGQLIEYAAGSEQTHYFMLLDRDPGRLDMEVWSEGFAAWRGRVVLDDVPTLQRHDFTLRRAQRVILRVQLASGEELLPWMAKTVGVHEAVLRIHALALRAEPIDDRKAREVFLDYNEFCRFIPSHNGRIRLPDGCAGALDVGADPPLVAAAWMNRIYLGATSIEAEAEEVLIRVDPDDVLSRLASLRLRVVDADTGEALIGVRAELSPPWTSGGWRATSDEHGRVQFPTLLPDNFRLTVTSNDYASVHREVQIDPGIAHDLGDVELGRAATLTGRVLDPEGRPVANITYQFFPTGSWIRPETPRSYSARTDLEGRIRHEAGPERHQIIIGGGEWSLQAEEWPRGGAEQEERIIRLQRGANVSIKFDTEGQQDRVVWLQDTAGRLLRGGSATTWGPWSLTLAPGPYLLRVEDLDRNLLTTLDLHVPDGGGELRVALP